MPRLKRPMAATSAPGDIPSELLDESHEVWQSEDATKRWLRRHGLSIAGEEVEWGPLNRHHSSAFKWAQANGFVRPPMANGYVGMDYARMRAAGLPGWDGGRYAIEMMRAKGVTFEEA